MKNFTYLIVLFIFLFISQPSFSNEDRETLIILDQSASMIEHYNGRPKIEYAFEVAKENRNTTSVEEKEKDRTRRHKTAASSYSFHYGR